MAQQIIQVDAFSDRPFAGNPAAVCVLDAPAEVDWMQSIAAEMNLSETAFAHPVDGGYNLRWFTPSVEVDLCGHATLATAHVLFEDGYLKPDATARFQTRSGELTVVRDGSYLVMDFPAIPIKEASTPTGMESALSLRPTFVGKSDHSYFVVLAGESELLACDPDISGLLQSGAGRVIITTAAASRPESADGDVDFLSRFFAPGAGVNEDPVTGSAHCVLGPYWAERLGKPTVVGYQASRRGGTVRVTVRGERVMIAGKAVTTMRGELV